MNKIFTTIGSKSILKQVINEHPERKLYLYQGNQDYQIVDPDSNDSIFKIPIEYTIDQKYGEINWHQDKNVTTLNVSDDERKLLVANLKEKMTHLPKGMQGLLLLTKSNNDNQLTITSFWEQLNDYKKWFNSDDSNFITKYQNDPNSNYYTINYQPTTN